MTLEVSCNPGVSNLILVAETDTRTVASSSSRKLLELAHGLARHDHARHPRSARGEVRVDAREAVAVGGDGAQGGPRLALGHVEVDAVEVVARLLRRDGELRLVEEPAQRGAGALEGGRVVGGGHAGKSSHGQRRELERRAPGLDGQAARVALGSTA
jgi:hypothetical protein